MYAQSERNAAPAVKAPLPRSLFTYNSIQLSLMGGMGGNSMMLRTGLAPGRASDLAKETDIFAASAIQRKTADDIMSEVLQSSEIDYADLHKNIEIDDEKLTFGVELEVSHATADERNHSVKQAEDEELIKKTSGAAHETSPSEASPGYWHFDYDTSLGDCDIEWVSPILGIKESGWNSIDKMCKVINDNHGTITDSCSEHIHVGHTALECGKDRFSNLFKLYDAFQDVIDVYARCKFEKQGVLSLRDNAETYAKEMSEQNPDKGFFEDPVTDFFKHVNGLHCQHKGGYFTVRGGINRYSYYKTAWDTVHKALLNPEADILQEIRENRASIGDLFRQINAVYDLNLSEDISEQVTKDEFQNEIRKIRAKTAAAEAFWDTYGINALNHENRQMSLNITQNYSSNREALRIIDTVEFRRFNGVSKAKIIQANVLITTLLMKFASEKTSEEAEAFITECEDLSNVQKALNLAENLTDSDEIKQILVQAYLANLNQDELPSSSSGEEEPD